MKPPLPSRPSTVPTRLGRYEVRAKIAEGGMATVYVGRLAPGQIGDHPVVALKVIRDELSLNRDFVNMFLDEAKIVSRFRHPSIVQVYELGVEGARVFIVMELLFGQSLWHVWDACKERNVRLRYDVIAWIGARVAEGLHYAHEMKDENGRPLDIVHRDVNATNIFITYDGQVKIIDFGLAKAANRASKTAAGIIKGKVAYMSPEQAIGSPIDRRTDLFALGTTLWELSVDRRLFKHQDEIETLKRVHAAEVPDPTRLVAGYPPELWAVLRRALARDKDKRPQTAAELARDLDGCTRIEGREVTPAVVAEVMRELFAKERDRQAAWLADASSPDRPAPLETLVPPSKLHATTERPPPMPGPPRVPDDLSPAAFSPAARVPGGSEPAAPDPRARSLVGVPHARRRMPAWVIALVVAAIGVAAVIALALAAMR